jgi:hypothetical protein
MSQPDKLPIPLLPNNTLGGKFEELYTKPISHRSKNSNLEFVWEEDTVAYALRARKQSFLGNGCVTYNNGISVGSSCVFCVARAEAV